MSSLKNMPAAGMIVIVVILGLFVLSVLMLFHVFLRYRRLARLVNSGREKNSKFLLCVMSDFADGYKEFGKDVNTPAVISNSIYTKLSGLLLRERFLNNAVSLFVTLGLFGTFLGLSLSVSSLTELISYSNTSEWLSVLDSVGGGLMSALSGMGVAFYTSLVGVACAILLTLLRSVFSPQNERERLENCLELWLDNTVAAELPTDLPADDAGLVRQMVQAIDGATKAMDATLKQTTDDLKLAVENSKAPIVAFNKTVNEFNKGVHDFSEFNYGLQGTVERMDLAVRELTTGLRNVKRGIERREQ